MLANRRIGQAKGNRPSFQIGFKNGDITLVVDGDDGTGMPGAVIGYDLDLCRAGNDMRRGDKVSADTLSPRRMSLPARQRSRS